MEQTLSRESQNLQPPTTPEIRTTVHEVRRKEMFCLMMHSTHLRLYAIGHMVGDTSVEQTLSRESQNLQPPTKPEIGTTHNYEVRRKEMFY